MLVGRTFGSPSLFHLVVGLGVGGVTSISIIFWACSVGFSCIPFKRTLLEHCVSFFFHPFLSVKYMKGLVTLSMSVLSLF